jgi:tubulin polyglutamylase TTLL6/13
MKMPKPQIKEMKEDQVPIEDEG